MGYLDALIVQDPYQMGYRGVYAMDQAIHGQEVTDKLVAIDAKVVTMDNITEPEIWDLLASYGDIKEILVEKGIEKAEAPAEAAVDPENADRTLVWIPKTTNSTFWLAGVGRRKGRRRGPGLQGSVVQGHAGADRHRGTGQPGERHGLA